MKKRMLAWLLTLFLFAGIAPTTVAALAEGATYVWVGVQLDESEYDTPDASPGTAISSVTASIEGKTPAQSLTDAAVWFNAKATVAYSFEDSDTTEGKTYLYSVSVDGGAFTEMTDGFALGELNLTTTATPYTMVFRVTDANDTSNYADSSLYFVYYDNEKPVILCKAGVDYTLTFYVGESISGCDVAGEEGASNNISVNGGSAWQLLLDQYYGQNVYSLTIAYEGAGTIRAKSLAVRDKAGNVAKFMEDIVVSEDGGSYSGSSGGSSGGSSTRTVYYSASTYTTVTPYNGVDLVVETGAMDTLTIGDQELGLSLRRERGNAPDEGTSGAETSTFSASFTDWNGDGTELTDAAEEDEKVDTLILTASDADAEETEDGGYAYSWTFDGSVYKKLAASGIDYLVLSAGEQATALSTAGFTAGIRYNLYRAAGIASKDFVYTIQMDGQNLQVQVSVDGEIYEMTDDESSELYYYDLYNGTMDMLDRPFGQEDAATSDGRQG